MPTPSSRRESRRSSKSSIAGKDTYKSTERREKSKSSQVYDGQRRGSRQAESGAGSVPARPEFKGRTNSAPLVDARGSQPGHGDDVGHREQTGAEHRTSEPLQTESRNVEHAQDEDEVAGVVGAMKHFQPFHSIEVWTRTAPGNKTRG